MHQQEKARTLLKEEAFDRDRQMWAAQEEAFKKRISQLEWKEEMYNTLQVCSSSCCAFADCEYKNEICYSIFCQLIRSTTRILVQNQYKELHLHDAICIHIAHTHTHIHRCHTLQFIQVMQS
jgi:hypothetical protein